jgi:GNAT superfamily N-acetyltransferase
MVFLAAALSDEDMLHYGGDLKFLESELIKRDALGHGVHVWKCATHTPNGVGFWAGGDIADGGEIYSYLALFPSKLGDLPVLEGKKAWTESEWRRKGLSRALLQAAAEIAPVISDSDGMTTMAFAQWNSLKGFRRSWWDGHTACFVDDATVPPEDRLTGFENGKRWSMMLELSI